VSSVLDETAKTVEIYKGVDYVINNLTIPDHIYNDKGVAYKVVRIAEGSFQNVLGLKGHLTIPDTVTNIGPGAFNGCHNLDGKLNIGLNVTYIGEHAFENTNFDFQIINGNKYSYGAK
jgi:hypothetical protein